MPSHQRHPLYAWPTMPSAKTLTLFALLWLAYTTSEALILWLQHDLTLLHVFKYEGLNYALHALLCIPVWYLARYRLQHTPWSWRLPAILFGSLLYAAIWVVAFFGLYPFVFSHKALMQSAVERYWLFMAGDAIRVYVMAVAITYSWSFYQRLRKKERREAHLLAHSRHMELAVLKSQLNPHFLFNTLNAVNALVSQQPEKAREVLALLGDCLRYALESDSMQKVPLAHELDFLHAQLAIESIRMGDKLKVDWHIDPQAKALLVPPMVLQPLVENAIRHGIAVSEKGGTIHICATTSDGQLHLQVRDDGPGPGDVCAEALLDKGRGLHHTDLRLRKLYSDAARLHLTGATGFTVTFTLPAEPGVAHQKSETASPSPMQPATWHSESGVAATAWMP